MSHGMVGDTYSLSRNFQAMSMNDMNLTDAESFRKQAEILYTNTHTDQTTELSADEKDKLLRELRIKQIELELRNKELLSALQAAVPADAARHAHAGLNGMQSQGDETFSLAFEYAPIGIGLISIETRWLRINKAFTEMLGYTQEDLSTKTSYELIHPDDLEEGKGGASMLLEGKISGYSREARYRHRDGRYISVVLGVSLVRAKDGTPGFYILELMDVTKRKEAEAAIASSEREFHLLAEAMPQIVWITNAGGSNIYFNQQWVEYTGLSLEESHGDGWHRPFHPDDQQRAWNAWQNAISNYGTYSLECRLRRKDGLYRWWLIRGVPVADEQGRIVKWFGTCTDIDDLKRAAEALALQHTAVESAANAIVITDTTGKILSVNRAFTEYTGYTFQEVAGKKLSILKSGRQSEQFYRNLWETVLDGDVWKGEIENRRKDGSLYTEEMTITPVRQEGGEITHFIAIKQDITEQKKLQQELLQSQKVLSIGTLAAGIAHDFNNILSIILGYTTMLEGKRLDERKFSECIAIITKSIDRGALLVQQILTFARKTDVSFEPIEVGTFIDDMISLLYETFPKTITLIKDFDIATDYPLIMADRTQIHQALLNLCVNARDAMPRGGTIRFALSVKDREQVRRRFPSAAELGYLCLDVIDSGEGMDKETRTRVFDPFFTTKEKGKGTGLGLSVVYGIMQSHQGYVDVDSVPNAGTTFTLYFPIPATSALGASASSSRQSIGDIPGGSEMILVIEDEPSLMELVCAYLETKGYRFMTASDGEEAVRIFAAHHHQIDLVLSDIGLPKMDGLAAFHGMKEIDPGIRTILASGFFEPGTKEQFQQAGAKGFIQKPYKLDEVLRTIRIVLDARV
jgi:two-component system, cell cycle sensor histidine kinase and response regulator CckA